MCQRNNLWESLIPRLHGYFRFLTLALANIRDELLEYTQLQTLDSNYG